MTDITVRPLVAGEEDLFDSLPGLRQTPYADGLATGGYRPERTWVALRDGSVVARAAWAQPPRPHARAGDPDRQETAYAVSGVDLAADPLSWVDGDWLVAVDEAGEPAGLAGTAGDACWPLLVWCAARDEAARPALLTEAVRILAEGGAQEVVADVDAHRVATVADLERTGFRQIRTRVTFR